MPIWKRLLLNLYYHGSRPWRWWNLRAAAARGRMPILVLLYHRIADDRANDWTLSNRMFARQIRWLKAHFEMVSLEEARRRVLCGQGSGVRGQEPGLPPSARPLPPSSFRRRPCVSVTFDDGYAENCHEAIPLLIREGIPCTYFVTVQNVLKGKPFVHDLAQGNAFRPNTLEQLRAMAAAGIEIGAHSYTHLDLARITDRRRLYREVVTAGEDLARALGRVVRYFAFPFGQRENLCDEAFTMARQAGYEAVCSAYGGYNLPGGDAFHLQRIAGDDQMIRLKNWATIDPRKMDIRQPVYELGEPWADPLPAV